MDSSPRLPVGQLLGQMLRSFRQELHRRAQEAGYGDVREAHLQVFGAIDWQGTRLTELAARANMTMPAMSELVDDLQRAGYVERRQDPRDGRAKLIAPTRKGRLAIVQALRAVREIEQDYARVVGEERFTTLVGALQELVAAQPHAARLLTSPAPAGSEDSGLPSAGAGSAGATDR